VVASLLPGFVVERAAAHGEVDAAMFGKGLRALRIMSPPGSEDASRG
jgi:hypothetical protein